MTYREDEEAEGGDLLEGSVSEGIDESEGDDSPDTGGEEEKTWE